MDGRRVAALLHVFSPMQWPLENVRGTRCRALPFPVFHSQIHHHYKTCFVFASTLWLRFSRPPLCLTFDCVWVPLVPVGSSLCWGPRCTQLESSAKDLPFVLFCGVRATLHERLCAEKKRNHSALRPSSEMLNVVVPSLFLVIWLCSLGDMALKDITDPMKSSQAWSRCHKSSFSVVVFDLLWWMIFLSSSLYTTARGVTWCMFCFHLLISVFWSTVQSIQGIEEFAQTRDM